MEKSKKSLYNKPILGFFNTTINDFEEHNGRDAYDQELEQEYWDCNGQRDEKILGLIRESDAVEIVKVNECNWIKLTCAIWTQYSYRQVKRLLKSKTKKVSVEIEVVDWHYDKDKILIIDEFIVTGITILGDKIKEGIPGACLNILDLIGSEKFSKKVKCLSFAYDKSVNGEKQKKENEDIEENDESNTVKFDLKQDDKSSYLNNKLKGLEEKKMTYAEKRELLEKALKLSDENKCFYVVDFSDDFVIINDCEENKFFKISYIMEVENHEEKDTVKYAFDFDSKQEVEPSWKIAKEVDLIQKSFVSVDGEDFDIDQLLQKYTELKEKCENSDNDEDKQRYIELEEKFNNLSEDYSKLSEDYETLNGQFTEISTKYADLTKEVELAEKERICNLGISMAEEEDELDTDDKKNIKEKCKKFEYSSTEEIENDIAKMLYQQKKNNRQKNFKSNVVLSQSTSQEKKTDDVWATWGIN